MKTSTAILRRLEIASSVCFGTNEERLRFLFSGSVSFPFHIKPSRICRVKVFRGRNQSTSSFITTARTNAGCLRSVDTTRLVLHHPARFTPMKRKHEPPHGETGDLFGWMDELPPKAPTKIALSSRVHTKKKVVIHSDGGCLGNPGLGAWAALIRDGAERIISGGEKETTNNRMELMAAIQALRSLDEPCDVEFFTDSTYLRHGISQWIHDWKRRGWLTKGKEPVKNQDLWQALDRERVRHNVSWHWERGHVGNHENELCDQACQAEMAKMRDGASEAVIP